MTAADGSTKTYTVTVNRPACTLNTGDIWCGVVTVGAYSIGGTDIGYGFVDAATDIGALSDKGFSVGTNSYTIDDVWVGRSNLAGVLNFRPDQRPRRCR